MRVRELKQLAPFVAGNEALERWVEALIEADGKPARAAKILGRHRANAFRAVHAIKREAARRGWLPDHGSVHVIPPGQQLRGVSALLGPDGEPKLTWVKTKEDRTETVQILMESLSVLLEDFRGTGQVAPILANKTVFHPEIMTWYPIGDHHFGMYSWAAETGADWDLGIAYRCLAAAFDRLVDSSPPSESCAILNVGDFFHMDNTRNQTPQSGNILDVDTRWHKVVKVGLLGLRYGVEKALTKHRTVHVYNVPGNHDPHTAVALSLIIEALFEGEERVVVHTDPAPFLFHRFGDCLIGMTHGDRVKRVDDYAALMASEVPSEWGATKYRYWYLGHLHTSQRYELPGCLVERFRTLAARDAWHATMGYGSGRDMTAIVLHRDYGEIERHTVPVQYLLDSSDLQVVGDPTSPSTAE